MQQVVRLEDGVALSGRLLNKEPTKGEKELNDVDAANLIVEISKLNENMKKIELALEALHDLLLTKGDDWFAK